MNSKKVFLLVAFIIFSSVLTFAQYNKSKFEKEHEKELNLAEPTEVNKKIITEIIEVTDYRTFFTNYCTKKIENHAEENDWNEVQINETIEKLTFENYSFTIYNVFASFSTDELETLLEAMKIINKQDKCSGAIILTNTMIQNNLDTYINAILDGYDW